MLLSIFQVLAEHGGQNGELLSNDVNMLNLGAEAVTVGCCETNSWAALVKWLL